MEQIIKSVSEKLGISESVVRQAIKVILQFAQKHATGTEWEKYVDRIPGASQLLSEPSDATGAENSLGGLLGSLGGLLGGQAGDAAKALAGLQAAGLQTSQIGPFVKTFVEKSREVVGPETVDEVIAKVPILQTFLKGGDVQPPV